MFLNKNKLNQSGFSHTEVLVLLVAVFGITSVGYFAFKHSISNSSYDNSSHISKSNSITKDTSFLIPPAQKTTTTSTPSSSSTTPAPKPTSKITSITAKGVVISTTNTSSTSTPTPPPTLSLTASPSTITTGSSSTISWTTTKATGCTSSGSWSGQKSFAGSVSTGSLSSSSTYSLLCSGVGGSTIATVIVTVTPFPPPTLSLTASPSTITTGSSSTISWTTTDATGCVASGSWSGSKASSGSISTGALSSSSTYSLLCSGAGGSTNASTSITVTAPTTCNVSPPTTSSNPTYPLIHTTTFTGSTFPSDFNTYGYGVQQPGGYIAANHDVLMGNYLQVQGYPDPNNPGLLAAGYHPTGVVGAGFDLSTPVPSSGGFDVCMSMTTNNWQNVHLVLISWPTDNNWNEGENDFFEGNPQSMQVNVHEIGSSPATNVYQSNWPSALGNGNIHLLSARWDPSNGYTFYLDGTKFATSGTSSSITVPTTPHHLSIQMQDIPQNSSATVSANVYWAAAYGYN
jgi:hypothetical protein